MSKDKEKKDDWNLVDYLTGHPITRTGYEMGWIETLRKKLIEDLFEEFEWLPEHNDEELRDKIERVINKRFGVE